MNAWPVIVRELRSQARQPFTYLLRMYAGTALLAVAWLFSLQPESPAHSGGLLFLWLHRTLLFAIWLLIPLGAADCISQERREGTLGLLFLTPLTAGGIVVAKCAAHGLRALTLWLAALPVLTLPFLLGGVTWQGAVISCLVHFCSILLVVAVSVLSSALAQRTQRALALTGLMGTVMVIVFAYVVGSVVALVFLWKIRGFGGGSGAASPWWREWLWAIEDPGRCIVGFLDLVFGGGWPWSRGSISLPAGMQPALLLAFGAGAVVTVIGTVGLLFLTARILRRRWREPVRSVRVERLEKTFCRPVLARGFLRGWLRRRLERNPIGWLEQRSWSGRLLLWSWLAVMVSVYSAALTSFPLLASDFDGIQLFLSVLLVLSLTATAAGSFRRERETGVMELLLVSPLSVGQVILGRLRGIWMQFAPSAGLLVLVWLFSAGLLMDANPRGAIWLVSSLLTVPVIGLRNSMIYGSYLGAFLATLLLGLLLPAALANLPRLLWSVEFFLGRGGAFLLRESGGGGAWNVALAQAVIAGLMLWSLHRTLRERRFAYRPRAG
jgi:ABC-type transport system involved in multi-copper enzyme maturation permease subunit